ncbi:uronyl 2-sulfotransferase-like [Clavelina lepadiformis]|uniref:uronyl 2-sulfotransferase-like n=1 Tax=Clavelina lepadiformis TaxID=159417 RepID=UPI004042E5B2
MLRKFYPHCCQWVIIILVCWLCTHVLLTFYWRKETTTENLKTHSEKDKALVTETPLTKEFQRVRNNPSMVIYNRIPKCASTVTNAVLAATQRLNANEYQLQFESWPHIKQHLNETEEKDLVLKWMSFERPTVFIRHLHFIDFEKYVYQQPAYINLMRNPVDIFISSYYFMRFGFEGWSDAQVANWLGMKPLSERNMSIEECFNQNLTRCLARNRPKVLAFFCGTHKDCRTDSQWSLDEAKKNVEKYFTVVGIVEDYNNTLKLLEKVFPRFFGGMFQVYQKMNLKRDLPHARTAHKVDAPQYLKAKLRQELHFQVEFYEFVRKRFYEQVKKFVQQDR